jgi:hypothetical protein
MYNGLGNHCHGESYCLVSSEMPKKLAAPPAEWKPVFEALASECRLNMDLRTGFETAQRFLDAI